VGCGALAALALWMMQGAGCASGQVDAQDGGAGWADDGSGNATDGATKGDAGGSGGGDGSGSGSGGSGGEGGSGSSGGVATDGGNCAGGGMACMPSNPCLHGVVDCASGTPTCVSTGNLPDGTSCGMDQVCHAGTCDACTQGAACTPSNACHTGTVDCTTGVPACQDTGTSVADGTACGASGICESGTCDPCGASGQHCCAGSGCSGSPLACIGAIASTCRTNVNPQCTCGTLQQGMELQESQSIWSCDGRFQLVLQSDDNLVLYMSGTALWASNTVGSGAAVALMQDDGNFVLYTSGGTAVWSSVTGGIGCGAYLAVQNDGNLVVYDGSGTAHWASNTCCH
jgi:hypothetical protein